MTDKSYFALKELMTAVENGEDALAEAGLLVEKAQASAVFTAEDKKAADYFFKSIEIHHCDRINALAYKFYKTYRDNETYGDNDMEGTDDGETA